MRLGAKGLVYLFAVLMLHPQSCEFLSDAVAADCECA